MDDVADQFRAARRASGVLHLDHAACGRSSRAVIAAVYQHLETEVRRGGYVAEAAAQETLDRCRAQVGELLGLPAGGVVFTPSAAAGLERLLSAWPWPAAARVGVLASEWGPNLTAIADRGLELILLPADAHGVLDLERLPGVLAEQRPTVVHLTHVASHRGLVQPVAEAVQVCRAAGVPVWVDAAQALGHVDVAAGADAVYATSRKWLGGPRGAGVVAIAERHWGSLRRPAESVHRTDLSPVQALDPGEAPVAVRMGFARAVDEYVAAGVAPVVDRLAEVGSTLRARVADVPGWELLAGGGSPAATTTLLPTAGQDVVAVREELIEDHGILTSAVLPWRAPWEDPPPTGLRLSPHVDLDDGGLERVISALEGYHPD